MAKLVTNIPNYGFPHQYDSVRFSASSPCRVTLSCDAGEAVFSLRPNSSMEIRLDDLAGLLRDFTSDGQARMFQLTWDEGPYTFKVLPCRLTLSQSATAFCARHFLTLWEGAKPTYMGAKETVCVYNSGSQTDQFSVRLFWANPDTGKSRETNTDDSEFDEGATMDALGYIHFDVSPSRFYPPAAGFILCSYEVSCGLRSQWFEVRSFRDAEPLTLLFRNCFGMLESFHFFGAVSRELKPTRSAASFRGQTRNYRVDSVPEFTARTGVLRPEAFAAFEDLCSSTYVLLPSESNAELCLTDCDLKLSSDRYAPQQGTLTWRYARQARHYEVRNDAHTFDATFDSTFK